MKTIKLLIIAVLTTLAFNAANAQIHLPPHPRRPPPPPKLHIKAPAFLRSKHHSTRHTSRHRSSGFHLPKPPKPHLPPPPPHP